MAKFCKYCGSPLEEGQVCGCAASQAAAQPAAPAAAPAAPVAAPADPAAPVAAPAAPAVKAGSLFNELKDVALAALKAPSGATVKLGASSGKLPLAGILAGVNAIAIFLLVWRVLASLVGSIMGLAGIFGAEVEIGYPIFPMLLAGIVVAAAFIGLYGLGLFLMTKVAKVELNIVDALVTAAGYSILPSALLLVATLLSFISLYLTGIVMAVALWVWFNSLSEVTREHTGIVCIHSTKNMAIAMAIRLVVLFLAIWLSYSILGWSLSELTIAGSKIGDLGSLLGDLGDLGGFLG